MGLRLASDVFTQVSSPSGIPQRHNTAKAHRSDPRSSRECIASGGEGGHCGAPAFGAPHNADATPCAPPRTARSVWSASDLSALWMAHRDPTPRRARRESEHKAALKRRTRHASRGR